MSYVGGDEGLLVLYSSWVIRWMTLLVIDGDMYLWVYKVLLAVVNRIISWVHPGQYVPLQDFRFLYCDFKTSQCHWPRNNHESWLLNECLHTATCISYAAYPYTRQSKLSYWWVLITHHSAMVTKLHTRHCSESWTSTAEGAVHTKLNTVWRKKTTITQRNHFGSSTFTALLQFVTLLSEAAEASREELITRMSHTYDSINNTRYNSFIHQQTHVTHPYIS